MGAYWDKAVIEHFFDSLKHNWLFKIHQPPHEHMHRDISAYMRYYNLECLHSANDTLSPIEFENSIKTVSGWTGQVHTATTFIFHTPEISIALFLSSQAL
ncbi:hypothetical protein ETN89_21095 (plasmid) [Photobacterium damselae subsp. damselae]|uniref:IS3 family transposase n=1 Tax=Photobacterium damselae TaxID=38293 RepID=UPI000A2FB6AA|nr:hypothetical protein CAY62_20105 [Photobacterium damselae subsp. damselae]QAY37709.1 hypothetical protein ETN89_21095 [Photobacterium damselae subsp. damselae]